MAKLFEEECAIQAAIVLPREPGPHARIADRQARREMLVSGLRPTLRPLAKLYRSPLHGGQIESRCPRANRVDPKSRVIRQELSNEVLATRGMPAPVVGEYEEGCESSHAGCRW